MTVLELDLTGRRVMRATTSTLNGEDPWIVLWTCWQGDPAWPVGSPHCVSFPVSIVPRLREVLASLESGGSEAES